MTWTAVKSGSCLHGRVIGSGHPLGSGCGLDTLPCGGCHAWPKSRQEIPTLQWRAMPQPCLCRRRSWLARCCPPQVSGGQPSLRIQPGPESLSQVLAVPAGQPAPLASFLYQPLLHRGQMCPPLNQSWGFWTGWCPGGPSSDVWPPPLGRKTGPLPTCPQVKAVSPIRTTGRGWQGSWQEGSQSQARDKPWACGFFDNGHNFTPPCARGGVLGGRVFVSLSDSCFCLNEESLSCVFPRVSHWQQHLPSRLRAWADSPVS